VCRGEVHQVRGDQPDVDHVDTLAHHSVGEGADEGWSGSTHVPSDHDLLGGPGPVGDEAGKSHAERVGDLRAQLVGNRATNVVGLDDLVEY
jgi:hypothetical protein